MHSPTVCHTYTTSNNSDLLFGYKGGLEILG